MTRHLRKEIIAPRDLRQSRLCEHDEQGNDHNLMDAKGGGIKVNKERNAGYQLHLGSTRGASCTNNRSINEEMDVCSRVWPI